MISVEILRRNRPKSCLIVALKDEMRSADAAAIKSTDHSYCCKVVQLNIQISQGRGTVDFKRCRTFAGSGVPWRRGVKRQWDRRERQFSAFSLVISSETLEMRLALLYSDMQSVVGFSAIPKFVPLSDLEWLFRVKFCFRTGLASFRLCDFRK